MEIEYRNQVNVDLIFQTSDETIIHDPRRLVAAIAEHEMDCRCLTNMEDWPNALEVRLPSGWQWFHVDMEYKPSFSVRFPESE